MSLIKNLAISAVLAMSAGTAHAAVYTSSYGNLVSGYVPNDDQFFGAVNLPFTINFFGNNYNSLYVSNNGNVTFGAGTGSFVPSPLNSQTTEPMIAPFWTDLDSRSDPLGAIAAGTGGSGVYFNQASANQVVVTWDRLGYFSTNYSGRALFQLVLNNPNAALAAGEGVIGLFYDQITSGTDTHQVTAGFGDGLSAINPGEISLFSGSSSSAASELSGDHYWFNLNGGVPTQTPTNGVPEPATLTLLGLGLAGLARSRRRTA